jgi:hypothetical protein
MAIVSVTPPAAPFASSGRTRYFVLEPGRRWTCEGREAGHLVRVESTLLDSTVDIDGVETRVLEERETRDGALVERSRNYLAIDSAGNLRYFGEDVDEYRDGRLTGHGGSWRSGVGGAAHGCWVPADPRRGMEYAEEHAPGIAMDRARVLDLARTIRVPAGSFRECLAIEETSPLEPGVRDLKVFAPGVGLVWDDGLQLVKVDSSAARVNVPGSNR